MSRWWFAVVIVVGFALGFLATPARAFGGSIGGVGSSVDITAVPLDGSRAMTGGLVLKGGSGAAPSVLFGENDGLYYSPGLGIRFLASIVSHSGGQNIGASGSGRWGGVYAASAHLSGGTLGSAAVDGTDGGLNLYTDVAYTSGNVLTVRKNGVAGTKVASVDHAGFLTTAGSINSGSNVIATFRVIAGGASSIDWNGRSRLFSPTDGIVLLSNAASADFNLLAFGDDTASFPALKRNGTGLDVRLGDDSAYAPLTADRMTLGTVYTSGTREACDATTLGDVILYDNGSDVISGNICEQTAAATFAWGAMTTAGAAALIAEARSGRDLAAYLLGLGGFAFGVCAFIRAGRRGNS